MAETLTDNLALTRPQPGASENTWGGMLNTDLTLIDNVFEPDGTGTPVGVRIGLGKKLVVEGTVEGAGYLPAGGISYAQIQNISVTDRLLGRMTAGAGPIEEIPCTAAGRAILDDADAAAQRVTLNAASLAANTFTDDQTLQSVAATVADGPFLVLDRASPDPAINDKIGVLVFGGRNSVAEETLYARMLSILTGVTDAAEAAQLSFETMVGGTLAERFYIGDGLAAHGLADKGEGTINVKGFYQNGIAAGVARGHIDGFTLSNSGTGAIVIGKGAATSSTNDAAIVLTSALTKQLTAVWAVGTGVGGLDTGTKANNTWYHVWIIMRPDTGVVDALFSLSATAPNMSAAGLVPYTKWRRVGAVLTSPSNIKEFEQLGDEFEWTEPIYDVDDASPPTTASVRTLTVPLGVRVLARITPLVRGPGGSNYSAANFASLNVTDQATQDVDTAALTLPLNVGTVGTAVWHPGGEMYVRTNTNQRIRTRAELGTISIGCLTRGWRDFRGRDAA